MESNEQTELTSTAETDSWMESRLLLWVGQLCGGGFKQKGERIHGQGQQFGDCGARSYEGDKCYWKKYN